MWENPNTCLFGFSTRVCKNTHLCSKDHTDGNCVVCGFYHTHVVKTKHAWKSLSLKFKGGFLPRGPSPFLALMIWNPIVILNDFTLPQIHQVLFWLFLSFYIPEDQRKYLLPLIDFPTIFRLASLSTAKFLCSLALWSQYWQTRLNLNLFADFHTKNKIKGNFTDQMCRINHVCDKNHTYHVCGKNHTCVSFSKQYKRFEVFGQKHTCVFFSKYLRCIQMFGKNRTRVWKINHVGYFQIQGGIFVIVIVICIFQWNYFTFGVEVSSQRRAPNIVWWEQG